MTQKTPQKRQPSTQHKQICIAILGAEPMFWTTCAKRFFTVILQNYQWTKNGTTYQFTIQILSDKEILRGELTVENFDALLIPGGGIGDGHSISKGFRLSLKTRRWKKKIQHFIQSGGGCIGFCGGASLITSLRTGLDRKPSTFVERQYNNSSLNVSCVTSYYRYLAFPLFYLFQYKYPERIGTTAYVFSFEPGITKDGKRIHSGGVPMDFQLDKKNPLFADYPKDTLRIRWWGGQALLTPEKPDRPLFIFARYPKIDLFEQKETRIHAWRYIGGIRGLVLAFFKAMKYLKKHHLPLLEFAMLTYYFAGDWDLSNHIIQSDLADRPAITGEIYPNEHTARIVLCTEHPEYLVWWKGHIQEKTEHDVHCLATGLYQWQDIELKDSLDETITHTWWLVRRLLAWTAKIPDQDMPPIETQTLSKPDFELLKPNILWDHTLANQMKNI